jgi:hypothetical protein
MFRHPKYYKELRKRNKSDQAISLKTHDGECERAPDPGLNHQAASTKRQASSFRTNPFNRQATSIPARVTSVKLQALSYKLLYPRTMVHGYWRSFRGQRTKGLCKYECVVWVLNMEGNLVRAKSDFVTFSNL